MNYSEMTDYEINMAASEALQCSDYYDYCNSWAYAGPIIHRELIALSPEKTDAGHYRWFAFSSEKEGYKQVASNSPLRSAMIIFLMMQEVADAS